MSKLEQHLKSNEIITKDDIKDYILKISKDCNLEISNVTFLNIGYSGYYNYKTKEININYDRVLGLFNLDKTFNFEILLTIFHELTHVIQQKQIFDNETYKKFPSYYVLLISNYFSLMNDKEFYCENHDDFVVEYSANVLSYLSVISLLKQHNIDYSYVESQYKDYLKNHKSFNLEKNIHDENLLINIANSEMRNDVLFKYRYALQHYGTEENLTKEEITIYGYKK